jgi:hypothetical protein
MAGIAQRVATGINFLLENSLGYEVFVNVTTDSPTSENGGLSELSRGELIGGLDIEPSAFNSEVVSKQLYQLNIQRSYSFIQAQYPFRCNLVDLYDSLWQFIKYFKMTRPDDCAGTPELIASIYLLIKKVFPFDSYYISDAHVYFKIEPGTHVDQVLQDIENTCASRIQHVARGFTTRLRYTKTLNAILSLQYLFRSRCARRTLIRALELASACCREGEENDITMLELVYRDNLVSPSAAIDVIHNIRHKLRALIRNQSLHHEIDGLHGAVESGDLPMLKGFLNSLSPSDRQEKLMIRDKNFHSDQYTTLQL